MELDNLNTGRRDHTCGHYKNNDGDTVRSMFSFLILQHNMCQVYLVTGGWDGKNDLSSTEILTSLTSLWITLESARLPQAMDGVRAVSVDNTIILTGNIVIIYIDHFEINILGGIVDGWKVKSYILKLDVTTEAWSLVGQLKKERAWHAMSVVSLDDVKNFCI